MERRAVDGRVAFAVAAFLALAGLVALLDRVGAPEGLVQILGPLFILIALATIGVVLRSMRVSRFYAAGRAVPTAYVGFAAVAICVGLALPFLPPSSQPLGTAAVAGALTGLVAAVLLLGPYLRKTGAFSIVDLIATRFPNVALRLGLAVTVAAIGALVGLAGFDLAVGLLTQMLGITRAAVAAGLAFVLVLVAAPGGISGVVWAANGAAGVLLAALGLPLALLLARGAIPMPILDAAPVWIEARRQLFAWQSVTPGSDGLLIAAGAAFAVAALVPLVTAPLAARTSGAAARSGILTLGWGSVVAALLALAMLAGVVVLSRGIVGKAPDRLPEAIYAASGFGQIDVCGTTVTGPAAARTACTQRAGINPSAPLSVNDVRPTSPLFLPSLAGAAGAGAAGVGLFAAALLAIGLTLAAAGFFLCATALGHDLFYRVQNRHAQTSRRLAVTRALLVATVAVGAAIIGLRDLDARLLIGLAATLAAATILPLLMLSVHPRAIGRDAVVALLVGLAGAEAMLFAHVPTPEVLLRGAFVGALAGVIGGFIASFVTTGDRADARAFVDAVIHAPDDVLAPDKAA